MTEEIAKMENAKPGYVPWCMHKGPGPAMYRMKSMLGQSDHCLSKKQAPAYSIGDTYKRQYSDTPGPSYKYDPNLTNFGKQEPKSFSLAKRLKNKAPETHMVPGPGTYDQALKRTQPMITMAGRIQRVKSNVPPPNAYTYKTGIGSSAATEPKTPSWGVQPRQDVGSTTYNKIKSAVPGPGTYGPVSARLTKRTTGPITIKGRIALKEYNSAKEAPGPGSYELSRSNTIYGAMGSKGFSMGKKHSSCLMPLITYHDI